MLQSQRFTFLTISTFCIACYFLGEISPVIRCKISVRYFSRSSKPVIVDILISALTNQLMSIENRLTPIHVASGVQGADPSPPVIF